MLSELVEKRLRFQSTLSMRRATKALRKRPVRMHHFNPRSP